MVAAGNAAGDFVPSTEFVTRNLWTSTTPELLKAGAVAEALRYLRDPDSALWDQRFKEIGALTVEEFKRFETSGPQSVRQKTVYCG